MKKVFIVLYALVGGIVYGAIYNSHVAGTYFVTNSYWLLYNVAFLISLVLGILRICKYRIVCIPKSFNIIYTIIISAISIAIIEIIWYQPKEIPRLG